MGMFQEKTHCSKHGLELEMKTLKEAKDLSFFFMFMFFFHQPSKYNWYGEERMYMCCPKGDELIEA